MENNFLKNLGISQLNEMQQTVLQSYDPEKDIVLLSPTGTGKTLAFSLIIQKRLSKLPQNQTQTIILSPTRELALQIEQVVRKIPEHGKVTCLYGGNDIRSEKNKLAEAPQILIGTPGRIIYHLERGNISLEHIDTVVLDEFDKSLELGFHEQMERILADIRQAFCILTSATPLVDFPAFLSLNNPITLDFTKESEFIPDLTIRKVSTKAKYKLDTLFSLICHLGIEKMIIFCNHREAVDHIGQLLSDRDIIHDTFHGGLDQFDRELAILKFRNNTNRILLTTDLAARGLDIPEVDSIIHYQLPSKQDAFIHRNGRTARMQNQGKVFVILKEDDQFDYLDNTLEEEIIDESSQIPPNSPMSTVMFNVGKKNKVNKVDLVGFLLNLGKVQKEDLGMIDVKEKNAFVAVNRQLVSYVINEALNKKIKGNKIRAYRI